MQENVYSVVVTLASFGAPYFAMAPERILFSGGSATSFKEGDHLLYLGSSLVLYTISLLYLYLHFYCLDME